MNTDCDEGCAFVRSHYPAGDKSRISPGDFARAKPLAKINLSFTRMKIEFFRKLRYSLPLLL